MSNAVGRIAQGAESLPEAILRNRIEHAGLPRPETQVRPVPTRRWRWDLGWPLYGARGERTGKWLLVEVQGGTWQQGRHTRGAGYANDAAKRNTAQLLGNICLDVTPEQIADGSAVEWIRQALEGSG